MKVAPIIAIVILGGFLLVKGILPAFQQVGTDFTNYYTSSFVLIHDRATVDRLYDKVWFNERARELGGPEGAIFEPFPPTTALVMVPLVALDLKTAKAVWTILNLGLLAFLVVALSRLGSINLQLATLLIFASGLALINNFFLGQVYVLMSLCLAFSFLFLRQERDVLAGIFAGIFIPIKYFPACLLILFLLQKRWTALWSTLATSAFIIVVSVSWMGSQIHVSFLRTVFLPHLDGEMANPFSATYQSWNSLLRTLFVHDATLNPQPFLNSSLAFVILRAIALVAPTAVFGWFVLRQHDSTHNIALFAASLFAYVLVIAPATATYHFLVLSVPVAMVFSDVHLKTRTKTLTLIVLLYVGVGLVPAGMMDRLGFSGMWKVFEFARLYLLVGLFFVTVFALNSSRSHLRNPRQEAGTP